MISEGVISMYNKVLCGLDIGTNSVGWCLTDENNKIIRKKGKALWGVRLFDEASDCAKRRQYRSTRRRLNRRRERIDLLRELMAEEIHRVDPTFFMRLDNSFFQKDDREEDFDYTLFNDRNYTDSDYYREYPTIYHLRKHLLESRSKEDIRMIYLALHHMMKYRGNFLSNAKEFEPMNPNDADEYFEELKQSLANTRDGVTIEYDTTKDFSRLKEVFTSEHGITVLKEKLGKILNPNNDAYIKKIVILLIAGGTIGIKDLKFDQTEDLDFKNLCVKDEKFDQYIATLLSTNEEREEEINALASCKKIYEFFLLGKLLGDQCYLSDAMVKRYQMHQEQLRELKAYVKKNHKDKYARIFRKPMRNKSKANGVEKENKKEELNNYAMYIGSNLTGNHKNRTAHCTAEAFYAFLKKELGLTKVKSTQKTKETYESQILDLMSNGEFLPRLNSTDNGVFPYQLNLMEMKEILNRQSEFYPFLLTKDEDGITVKDQILSVLEYKIPYFVGPLIPKEEGNERSKYAWIKRTDEKIRPWNFKKVVDLDETAKNFIYKMLNKCTYLPSCYCLPKDSLLFSYFNVLQILNKTSINGASMPKDFKECIIENLFRKRRKVTKKQLVEFIRAESGDNQAQITTSTGKEMEEINASLASYYDFKDIFGEEYVCSHIEEIEDMIRDIVIFEDKSILEKRLKQVYRIQDKTAIRKIKGLNYSKFSNLSKELLTDLKFYDESSERNCSVLQLLEETNQNLQEILYDETYGFQKKIEEYNKNHSGTGEFETIEEYVKELGAVSPGMKRPLIQAYKICDELEKIIGQPIDEYYVECTRTNRAEKKRTSSRYKKMQELYEEAIKTAGDDYEFKSAYEKFKSADPNQFQSDKYYLYFSQMGKCMYSGEAIDIGELYDTNKYDIDHILPQSMIKDDSLSNRVLVKQSLNRTDKRDQYPIPQSMLFNGNYREAYRFYQSLKEKKLISEEKYHRLIRKEALSEKELSSFVNRQLVSTNQAVKGFINAIRYFKTTESFTPKIIFSKSENVSDFRKKHDLVKCRSANNFHHAHDAYLNIVVGRTIDNYFAPYDPYISHDHRNSVLQEMHANGLTTNPSKIFEQNKEGTKKNITDRDGYVVWDYNQSIQKVKKTIKNRYDILTTQRTYFGNSFFGKMTIMPKGEGNISVKKGWDKQKYGGFKEYSFGSYSLIKVKDQFILEAIPTMLRKRKEEYLRERFGEYEIRLDNLKINTVFEVDKKKFVITGKTGDRYLLMNQKDRIFSSEQMETLRKIDKLFDKLNQKIGPNEEEEEERKKLRECGIKVNDADMVIAPAKNDQAKEMRITQEEAVQIYETFIQLFSKEIYSFSVINKLGCKLEGKKKEFQSLSLFKKVYLIQKINNLLRCNERKTADLRAIGFKEQEGTLTMNQKLSTCRIVFESITGFYRKVVFECKDGVECG